MKTIIKSGYAKILKLFYNQKSAKIHLRDLARKTNLNENSVSRFLKTLEQEKILISKRDANQKKYEIVKNDLIYSIFSHFDILRFNQLPLLRKNALLHFLDKLEEKPLVAFLFGSTAKETFTERSDLDLLLIVNEKIPTKKAEDYVDAQTAIKISSIQISLNEFKKELKLKEDYVIQSAINTGYPLTNHIEYYRTIYNERI